MEWLLDVVYPIASAYGIFTYIYHKNHLNEGKYNIPDIWMVWYGYVIALKHTQETAHSRTCYMFIDAVVTLDSLSSPNIVSLKNHPSSVYTTHAIMAGQPTPPGMSLLTIGFPE